MADNDVERLRKKAETIIERATGPGEARVQAPLFEGRQRLTADEDDTRARKAANVEAAGREELAERFDALREEVAETADSWSQQVRPDESKLREELRSAYKDAVEDAASMLSERVSYLKRTRERYAEELPDYDTSSTPHTEREVRAHLKSLEPEERDAEVKRIAREGTDAERRAVIHSQLSPTMAGLRDADQREQVREEALRNEAPDAFQSVQSLDQGIESLSRELDRFEETAAEVVGRQPQFS